jgi:predicted permease
MQGVLLLLPDFGLILLGWALYRLVDFGEHFWSGLEKLVYFVLFPALLFKALASTHIDFATAAPLFASGAAALGCGVLFGLFAAPLFKGNKRFSPRASSALSASTPTSDWRSSASCTVPRGSPRWAS